MSDPTDLDNASSADAVTRDPATSSATEGTTTDTATESPATEVTATEDRAPEAQAAAEVPPAPPEVRTHPDTPRRATPRDIALAVVGVLGQVLVMTRQGHTRWGVPAGIVFAVMSVLGLLGVLGDSPLTLRGDEVEAPPGERGDVPWYRREGVWTVLFGALLYFPRAGSYGLWDPWETHYSEVAREILSRDDWITTWWGQEGWFMSKPILIFWMSALGMGLGTTFGLHIEADSGPQFQEWCIRLPISALAIGALYAMYRAVASAWGRRAGLLVAFVLATMPHFFFLAHQAMTDMPFVAPLTIAMSMLMLAITVGERHAAAHRWSVRGFTFRWSLWHSAIGLFLLLAVPQVVYLITRPMLTGCPEDSRIQQCEEMLRQNRIGTFQFPIETYFYGSAGNSADSLASSVPGSPQWERLANVVPFFPSAVQALVWITLGAAALWILRRERRMRDLYMVLFYVWGAVSTMGKGPAGMVIPVAVAVVWVVTSARWELLRRVRFGTGTLVFLVVGMPWYVAILGRLGNEFFDRFVVHDLINRTVVGVHGDTGTIRYFLWQLGYAMFPWSGLVPVALLGWRQVVGDDATREQRDIARVGTVWFVLTFTLFSAMITKFHHYIFPAVPGAALMVGLLLHRMLGRSRFFDLERSWQSLAALAGGVIALVVGVGNFVGSVRGTIPRDAPNHELLPGSTALGVVLLIVGAGLLVLSWWLTREESTEDDAGETQVARMGAVSLGAMAIGGASVLAFVARDLSSRGTSPPPGYQRLLQLFTYQYERQWPTTSLNYQPVMIGFGVVAVAVAIGLSVHRLRGHAVRGMVVVASLFAAWALDVYMVDISQHWSQRTLFERYYDARAGRRPLPDEPRYGELARYDFEPCGAYQMNWKGENFYTGGRCAMLDCGDLPFCSNHARQWIQAHRGQRLWFVTERSHGPGIISHVRAAGGTAQELTTEWDQNKFVLVLADLRNVPSGSAAPAGAP